MNKRAARGGTWPLGGRGIVGELLKPRRNHYITSFLDGEHMKKRPAWKLAAIVVWAGAIGYAAVRVLCWTFSAVSRTKATALPSLDKQLIVPPGGNLEVVEN